MLGLQALEELAALKALGQNTRAHLVIEASGLSDRGGRHCGGTFETIKQSDSCAFGNSS